MFPKFKTALAALLLVVSGAAANAATVTPISPLSDTNFTADGEVGGYQFLVTGTGSFSQNYAFSLGSAFEFTVGENNSGSTITGGTLSIFSVADPLTALVSAVIAPPGASGQAATISDFLLGPGDYFFRIAGTATGTSFVGGTAGVHIAAAVPEASTWAMMVLGFAAVGFAAYRRQGVRVRLGPSA